MKRKLLPWLYLGLIVTVSLTSCRKKKEDTQKEEPAHRQLQEQSQKAQLAKKRKLELKQKYVEQAIQRVKKYANSKGWTVAILVEQFKKISIKIAQQKNLPAPSGYTWSGSCSTQENCTIRLEFWDGRSRIVAIWQASNKIVPLNQWAKGFTPKYFPSSAPLPPTKVKTSQKLKIVIVSPSKGKKKRRRRSRRRRRRSRRRRRRSRRRRRRSRRRRRTQKNSGGWKQQTP